jgi:hypothetical protein
MLTPEGIERGWQVEHMLEGRIMPELILMPNGEVIIISGGLTGYAAIRSFPDTFGPSNAANPVYISFVLDQPYIFSPFAGSRHPFIPRQRLLVSASATWECHQATFRACITPL